MKYESLLLSSELLQARNPIWRGLSAHTSFDLEEPPPDDEPSTEKIEETLNKFREGGRFEYKEERKSHFEIKYWYVIKETVNRYNRGI